MEQFLSPILVTALQSSVGVFPIVIGIICTGLHPILVKAKFFVFSSMIGIACMDL